MAGSLPPGWEGMYANLTHRNLAYQDRCEVDIFAESVQSPRNYPAVWDPQSYLNLILILEQVGPSFPSLRPIFVYQFFVCLLSSTTGGPVGTTYTARISHREMKTQFIRGTSWIATPDLSQIPHWLVDRLQAFVNTG